MDLMKILKVVKESIRKLQKFVSPENQEKSLKGRVILVNNYTMIY